MRKIGHRSDLQNIGIVEDISGYCPYPSQLCEEKVNLKDLHISPEAAIKPWYNSCHCFKGHSFKIADEMYSHYALIRFVRCWKKYVDISRNKLEFSFS